jgi:hypothetical protein
MSCLEIKIKCRYQVKLRKSKKLKGTGGFLFQKMKKMGTGGLYIILLSQSQSQNTNPAEQSLTN